MTFSEIWISTKTQLYAEFGSILSSNHCRTMLTLISCSRESKNISLRSVQNPCVELCFRLCFFFLTLQKNCNSIFIEHFWSLLEPMFSGTKLTGPIYRTCFFRPVGGSRGVVRDVKKCKKVRIVRFVLATPAPPPEQIWTRGPCFLGCISLMPSFARVFRIL